MAGVLVSSSGADRVEVRWVDRAWVVSVRGEVDSRFAYRIPAIGRARRAAKAAGIELGPWNRIMIINKDGSTRPLRSPF